MYNNENLQYFSAKIIEIFPYLGEIKGASSER